MQFNEPKAVNLNKFSLYLEGARVPFNTITIQEMEGVPCTAAIVFPSGSGALRVLPGTVTQMFARIDNRKGIEEEILIFEGEVVSLSYQKDSTQRICTLQCQSLMQTMLDTKKASNDSLFPTNLDNSLSSQAQVIINRDGEITGPLTNRQMKVLEGAQLTKEDLINISEMAFYEKVGFSSYLLSVMKKADFSAGDFQHFLEQIENFYELHNTYYGVTSQAFKLKSSLFAFPNPAMSQGFVTPVMEAALKDLKSFEGGFNASGGTALWEMVAQFLNAIKYRMFFPAAYTEARMFYNSQGVDERKPIRGIIAPDMENAPPAWCNVIFPDQVAGFGYSRNYKQEPTRAIGSVSVTGTENTVFANLGAFYVVPFMEASKADDPTDTGTNSKKKKFMAKFTPEECYRGVNPLRTQVSNSLLQGMTLHAEANEEKLEDPANWSTAGDYMNMLKHETLKSFLTARGQAQAFSITTDWCPFRFVGLPGVALDLRGPSVVGVVSSISTTISADGTAQQSLTFRNPRLVHDNEFDVDGASSPFAQADGSTSNDTDKQYLINDFSSFGMLSTNEVFYDPDMYSFANMGMDAYTYLLWGTWNARKQWKKMKEDDGAMFKKDPDSGEDSFEANIDDFFTKAPSLIRRDCSILSVLRSNVDSKASNGIDKAYERIITLPKDFIRDGDSNEIKNAKMVYLSIKRIKDQYLKLGGAKNLDDLGNFTQNRLVRQHAWMKNYRTIIKKNDYLAFIGAMNTGSLSSNSYKDTIAMVTENEDFTVASFKLMVTGDAAQGSVATAASDKGKVVQTTKEDYQKKKKIYDNFKKLSSKKAYKKKLVDKWMDALRADVKAGKVSIETSGYGYIIDYWASVDWGEQEYTWEQWEAKYDVKAYKAWLAEKNIKKSDMNAAKKKYDTALADFNSATDDLNKIKEAMENADANLFKCYDTSRLYHVKKAFNTINESLSNEIQDKAINPVLAEGVNKIVLNE